MYKNHYLTILQQSGIVTKMYLLYLFPFFYINVVPVTATVNPNASIHFNQTTTTINCTASGIPAPTVQFINVTCNNEELGEAAEGIVVLV